MNVVLYTRDLEPITVIDLPMWAIEMGQQRQLVSVAVVEDIPLTGLRYDMPIPLGVHKVVTLEFHKLRMDDKTSYLVTVDNDELALQLKPYWLSGQRGAINAYEHRIRSLCDGLLNVLRHGMGGH